MADAQPSKSELLKQLKIARTPSAKSGVSVGIVVSVAVLALLLGALISYFLFAGAVEDNAERSQEAIKTAATTSPGEAAEPISTTPVTENTGPTILNASGYITARLVATVSAEILGQLVSVDVEEGMEVKEGQVLARLDDTEARVALDLANARVVAQEARLNSIRADLAEAERVLRRISNLKTVDFSSEAELTRAQANFDIAKASFATTQADIEVARLQVAQQQEVVNNHTVRAPFAGVVTVKNAQPGEIVSPSSAGGGFTRTGICTIVDMGSLEIEVDVNEAFIGRVYPDQKVVANLDAYPQWDIPASVIAIIPTADRAKATVSVRIKIDAADPRILPDMGVKVAFLK